MKSEKCFSSTLNCTFVRAFLLGSPVNVLISIFFRKFRIAGEEYPSIWNNRPLGDKFFLIWHGVRYGHFVFKIHRKQNGRALWSPLEVKFKMAAKTTINTNKCNISARF